MDPLIEIKRLVMRAKVLFTLKAEEEIEADGLTEDQVCEAIVSARRIFKTLRSRNPESGKNETLHVIKGVSFEGILIYTKGKIARIGGVEFFYVLISSKRSTDV